MFRKHTSGSPSEGEAESPWISFTDLMAGFLIVILVALAAAIIMLSMEKISLQEQREKFENELVEATAAREQAETAKANALEISKEFIQLFEELRASQKDIDATVQQMDNYDQSRLELLTQMQDSLSKQSIKVTISKAGDVMHISEDNLSFDLGKYDIGSRFKSTMLAIGSEVAHGLQSPKGKIIDTVFVEGHTDNVPNSREMGNWGLSSYRAISLWQFWTSSPPPAGDLPNLKNAENEAMFSVTGYGETRPLKAFAPEGVEDQRINRRIDLRFNLQTAKKGLLVELSDKVSKSVENFDKAYEDLKARLNTITEDAESK
jgi:flagellar motor protein MotB